MKYLSSILVGGLEQGFTISNALEQVAPLSSDDLGVVLKGGRAASTLHSFVKQTPPQLQLSF